MIPEFWLIRVKLVAEAKYNITLDILESYKDILEECHALDYSPRRTVEVLATHIFN